MNANILKAAAIALPMVLGTAFADDTQHTQDALSGIAPMSSSELSMVTGAADFCFYCGNYAAVTQVNLSHFSAFVFQKNYSDIYQDIN